jgi:hypothetical protein
MTRGVTVRVRRVVGATERRGILLPGEGGRTRRTAIS